MPQLAPALIATAVTAVASTGLSLLTKPKVPILPTQINRDDASSMINQNDALLARKGGASDFLNGDGGAAPSFSGPKQLLGS